MSDEEALMRAQLRLLKQRRNFGAPTRPNRGESGRRDGSKGHLGGSGRSFGPKRLSAGNQGDEVAAVTTDEDTCEFAAAGLEMKMHGSPRRDFRRESPRIQDQQSARDYHERETPRILNDANRNRQVSRLPILSKPIPKTKQLLHNHGDVRHEEHNDENESSFSLTKSFKGVSISKRSGAEEKQMMTMVARKQTAEVRYKTVIEWRCKECDEACVPVRDESRCLCGHRLKQHSDGKGGHFKCDQSRCDCRNFFFIVAEGAWILRCSCKHKHIDHDPKTHSCNRGNCDCKEFFSPWVCNCAHAWSAHEQVVVKRRVKTMEEFLGAELNIGGDAVKRTDLLQEPLILNQH